MPRAPETARIAPGRHEPLHRPRRRLRVRPAAAQLGEAAVAVLGAAQVRDGAPRHSRPAQPRGGARPPRGSGPPRGAGGGPPPPRAPPPPPGRPPSRPARVPAAACGVGGGTPPPPRGFGGRGSQGPARPPPGPPVAFS